MKVLTGLVIWSALSICTFAQTNKIIEWPKISPESAMMSAGGKFVATDAKGLEIVELLVEGKPVDIGQSFHAGKEWLKTLGVRVRNVSDKKIVAIRLHFALPEAKRNEIGTGFSLEYGKDLSTGIDYGIQQPVEPGQDIFLIRNDRHYERDRNGIANRTGVTEFSTVVIGSVMVKFEDGVNWSSNKLPMAASQSKNQ